MILDKIIKIKKSSKTYNYYLKKGYRFDNDEVMVDVNDLPEYSHQKIKVRCDVCGIEKIIPYFKYKKNFNNCNYYSCSVRCSVLKYKSTLIKKYGTDILYDVDDIKNKYKQTCLLKYGFDYHTQNDNIKDKIKNKNKIKYDTECCLTLKTNRLKMLNKLNENSVFIKRKRKETNLLKYGYEHHSQNDDIKRKIKDTNLKLYGNKNGLNKEKYFKTLINNFKNKYKDINFIKIDYSNQTVELYCNICNKNYIMNFGLFRDRYIRKNLELCTNCNPIGSFSTSNSEKELLNYIKENYDGIIKTNIKILKKYEIDIYLPELKIGFEFNGIYWHNNLNKPNNYHKNKTDSYSKKGISIIHVYEDDWNYKNDIIKSMVLNKIHKTKNKIFAKKCKIYHIKNSDTVIEFFNNNHIEGHLKSDINIGLFYDDELVSLMSFNKNENENEYELIRFCSKLNYVVVGGATKIFNYFIKIYKPIQVISFLNKDYSIGSLYKIMNFNIIEMLEPKCYIVLNNKREDNIHLNEHGYNIYNSGFLKIKWNYEN